MNKTVFAYLAMFCLSVEAVSGQTGISLIGGIQQSSIIEQQTIPGRDTSYTPWLLPRKSFHAGIMADIPLSTSGKWFLSPGLMYSGKGNSYSRFAAEEEAQQTDTVSHASDFFTNYIELPLYLTRKFSLGQQTRFVLSAGPYLAFVYSGHRSTNTKLYYSDKFYAEETNLEVGNGPGKVKTFDAGVHARAGFEFNKIMISGFFSRGLTPFYQDVSDTRSRHQVMGISLSVRVGQAAPTVKDRDGDGIPDAEDACPDQAGSILTGGCPDRDGDGIADANDNCPDIAGKQRYKGCPVPDSDGDGIDDENDQCPDKPGDKKYGGCPVPDTDGDGITDDKDQCPNISGVAEYQGCPIPDRDKDGVPDGKDKCPDTPGKISNNGCPDIARSLVEKVELAATLIQFATNSVQLDSSSHPALDAVVDMLMSHPTINLTITGHTDNTGNPDLNKRLSLQRAESVKLYLQQKGIAAERLKAVGMGQERPLASNEQESGRARNRRVELELEQ